MEIAWGDVLGTSAFSSEARILRYRKKFQRAEAGSVVRAYRIDPEVKGK